MLMVVADWRTEDSPTTLSSKQKQVAGVPPKLQICALYSVHYNELLKNSMSWNI